MESVYATDPHVLLQSHIILTTGETVNTPFSSYKAPGDESMSQILKPCILPGWGSNHDLPFWKPYH